MPCITTEAGNKVRHENSKHKRDCSRNSKSESNMYKMYNCLLTKLEPGLRNELLFTNMENYSKEVRPFLNVWILVIYVMSHCKVKKT